MIIIAAILLMTIFSFPSTRLRITPANNIRGIVPLQKQNIEKAPLKKLFVDKATICIACNGPHGMKPLSSPITKGFLVLVLYFKNLILVNFIIPSIFKDIKNIKVAAKITIILEIILLTDKTLPISPTTPPNNV